MTPLAGWLTILGMGAVTYLIRVSAIAGGERMPIPSRFQQGLRLVPIAVLSALIAPELLRMEGVLDLSQGNARCWAGLLAIGIAWRTRSVGLTLAGGMVALWALQAWQAGS